MTFLQAFILSVIEGLTEYLPISSTGHLIIASYFMGLNEDSFVKSFNIIIQSGAILSVLVLYWRRLKAPLSFYLKIACGFLPAAVIGLLVKDAIDAVLGSVLIVATALLIGGIFLIWLDRRKKIKTTKTIENLSYRDALLIGLCQCVAFIPGVSRAAATIVSGNLLGLSKKEAAEFSFFLAVPTLTGATFIKGLKVLKTIEPEQTSILIFGIFVSFVVALIAIKTFIALLSRQGYSIFGIYRVILGLILLLLALR